MCSFSDEMAVMTLTLNVAAWNEASRVGGAYRLRVETKIRDVSTLVQECACIIRLTCLYDLLVMHILGQKE